MDPCQSWYVIIDLHGGPSSAITKAGINSTSYAHRNARLKFQFSDIALNGTYPEGGESFLNGWVGNIIAAMDDTQLGMYINYPDATLSTFEAHRYYWRDQYERLSRIKRKYDPRGIFTNPQAINRK